jgi:hypothetical protein
MRGFRKKLSIPGLLKTVRQAFKRVTEPTPSRRTRHWSIGDCLHTGLALFGFKYSSLLHFDQTLRDPDDPVPRQNMCQLYGLDKVPSDTYLRERLDGVEPNQLRPAFNAIFTSLQRGKALEDFQYLGGHYLLSIDGTGMLSSPSIHCDGCCETTHSNGTTTYHHPMIGAVLVHPDHKHVIPFAPEPIQREDGATKNDCERNAVKRLLVKIRHEHPHLPLIVIEDGLASNGPHIKLLQELGIHFILGAKPGDHKLLCRWVDHDPHTQTHEYTDDQGIIHRFRYLNNVPLNASHVDCLVNFLEYEEFNPHTGKTQRFSWVTDFTMTTDNVYDIMRGGRARWKVENEAFNNLKNQGYCFEHSFGHGQKHLVAVWAYLIFLAFLIDQVQGLCCHLFKLAMQHMKRPKYFWERLRCYLLTHIIESWEGLWVAIRSPPTMKGLGG